MHAAYHTRGKKPGSDFISTSKELGARLTCDSDSVSPAGARAEMGDLNLVISLEPRMTDILWSPMP